LIPEGEDVTVPDPAPDLATVKFFWVKTELVNVATIFTAAFTVTLQSPVPEHPPPDQPAKVDPASAVGVKTNTVPGATFSAQSVPQSMPAGMDTTRPVPVPALVTPTAWLVVCPPPALDPSSDLLQPPKEKMKERSNATHLLVFIEDS
jgi:hypothetical protein